MLFAFVARAEPFEGDFIGFIPYFIAIVVVKKELFERSSWGRRREPSKTETVSKLFELRDCVLFAERLLSRAAIIGNVFDTIQRSNRFGDELVHTASGGRVTLP